MTPLEALFLVLAVAVLLQGAAALYRERRRARERERELSDQRALAAARIMQGRAAEALEHSAIPAPSAKWDTSADICANCRTWDHAAGQNVINEHPAFKNAAAILSPQVMASQVDEDGKRIDNNVPSDCQWEDFGACSTHEELRWAKHTCDKFDRRSDLVQLKVAP